MNCIVLEAQKETAALYSSFNEFQAAELGLGKIDKNKKFDEQPKR